MRRAPWTSPRQFRRAWASFQSTPRARAPGSASAAGSPETRGFDRAVCTAIGNLRTRNRAAKVTLCTIQFELSKGSLSVQGMTLQHSRNTPLAITGGTGTGTGTGAYDYYLSAPRLIQFSAEPFEYPRQWPTDVRLVGPGLWDPGGGEPDWLAAEKRPIVLLSTSTEFQDDGALIEVGLKALADEPVAVIATTAANDPAAFRPPANARVERFLPHGPILRRASAVVCHGGMGTTQKALAAAVPVCVVPFLRDQFEIARRVTVCRAGDTLPAKKLAADRLRSTVRTTIGLKAGAERVADAFRKAGGPRRAADELEALLR